MARQHISVSRNLDCDGLKCLVLTPLEKFVIAPQEDKLS